MAIISTQQHDKLNKFFFNVTEITIEEPVNTLKQRKKKRANIRKKEEQNTARAAEQMEIAYKIAGLLQTEEQIKCEYLIIDSELMQLDLKKQSMVLW